MNSISLAAIKPNLTSMLEVSTVHIPRRTSVALGEDHQSPGSAELFKELSYVHWHEYGWIILCSEDAMQSVANSHPELSNLIGICVSHRIDYLKLDGDGPAIEDLPSFDWDALPG